MRFKLILTQILFLLLITFISLSQNAITNQRLYDTVTSMRDHYQARVTLFQQQPIVKGRIVFLGNSITEMGKWSELLGDTTVINRGIGGDITYGVLNRLKDVTDRAPSKLFLLIGINDISKDIPDVVIADNIMKIIERVKKESPSTKIYVHSLLPLNPQYPGFPQHYDKQDHVLNLNTLLKEIATKTNVKFIDIFPLFLDSNKLLDKKYTMDGLHLNEEGYKRWVNYLKEQKIVD
jgi:lysophospholipase L1-like esterase